MSYGLDFEWNSLMGVGRKYYHVELDYGRLAKYASGFPFCVFATFRKIGRKIAMFLPIFWFYQVGTFLPRTGGQDRTVNGQPVNGKEFHQEHILNPLPTCRFNFFTFFKNSQKNTF